MPARTFTDERMLQFMEFVVNNKILGIENEKQFAERIEYSHVSNLWAIKNGTQSFTIQHIISTVQTFHVDANFFFLKESTQMFIPKVEMSPLMVLKEAVALVEAALVQNSKPKTVNQNVNRPAQKGKKAK